VCNDGIIPATRTYNFGHGQIKVLSLPLAFIWPWRFGAVVSGINILAVLRAHLCTDSYYCTVFYVSVLL